MHLCHACKHEIELDPSTPLGRRDECPSCYAYLHCCLNCRHHDPGAHNQCRETTADFVRDRENFNFCGHFSFKDSDQEADTPVLDAKARAEAAFAKLGARPKR